MIKSKLLKKVLSTALVLSLVMVPVVGVNATTQSSAPVVEEEGTSDTGTSSNTAVTSEEAVVIPSTSTVTAGGIVLKSTVKGAYMSVKIPGTVVVTDQNTLSANYGLAPGEEPYVRVYDITEKNSPAAMASVTAAAQAIGGTVVATANVELGKKVNGKFSLLPQDGAPITMVFGMPEIAVKTGGTSAVICVRPGGAVEVLSDQDDDPRTTTFNTTGGLGAYAIVMH